MEREHEETQPCPICGKQMVRMYDPQILLSIPPKQRWEWYCGCGHIEPGGMITLHDNRDNVRERWETANKED